MMKVSMVAFVDEYTKIASLVSKALELGGKGVGLAKTPAGKYLGVGAGAITAANVAGTGLEDLKRGRAVRKHYESQQGG